MQAALRRKFEQTSGPDYASHTPSTYSFQTSLSAGTHTITYDVYNYGGGGTGFSNVTTVAVPEPAGLILLGSAGFLTLARRRRQSRPRKPGV